MFGAGHGVQPVRADVDGVISLVFWTITLVVTVKYVTFVMRADDDGEGGIMALLALILRTSRRTQAQAAIVVVGLVGAGLFYGDGMVTPAISVLAAVELEVATTSLGSVVVPAALAVLTLLFAIQRFGSGAAGVVIVHTPSAVENPFFVAMWRNQTDPAGYFDLPEEQTVTMGALVEL